MGLRRKAREYALQLLFQQDSRQQRDLLSGSLQPHRPVPKSIQDFSDRLVQGVIEHLSEIDPLIRKYTEHWSLERMALVDRNILRIAVFELLYLDDIPARVTLNEAIEIAKRYGDESSSAFINGILDRILCEEERMLAKKVEVQKSLNANQGA
jgi:transcription antitermination protein NusB